MVTTRAGTGEPPSIGITTTTATGEESIPAYNCQTTANGDTVSDGIQEVGAMHPSGAFGYLFINVRKPNCRIET
jgi:hypothetical protein